MKTDPKSEAKPRTRVLVVDDQPAVRRLVRRVLEEDGYQVFEASDGAAAMLAARANPFHLVITDLAMPHMDGMDLLQHLRTEFPETVVVLLTAYGSIKSAVEAMRLGAFDYLSKPLSDPEEIRVIAQKAIAYRRLEDENDALRGDDRHQLIYEDSKMDDIVRVVGRVAGADATILITGESGTGKEVIARLIHLNSRRAQRPFVAINCAALPETLLESELFGHERGAFTGADQRKRGRFEVADGGTLFLDEIAEMSPSLQAKLLRVMQERSFERMGGTATISVDVRVVTATNRELAAEIAAGRFREDLFYRLNVVPIVMPPLRERGSDSLLLARHFLVELGRAHGRQNLRLSESAEKAILGHSWPGNVRELRNIIERTVLLCPGTEISARDLSLAAKPKEEAGEPTLELKALERQAITRALEKARGNRREAAEILGIALRTLHYKLNEYGLRDYEEE